MAFIDVVYKIKDDERDNINLKYSLRSLINFHDIGNVYIVGHLPTWAINIKHINVPDTFSIKNKDANIINKLIAACSNKELSEYFLNISDDQLFLKETTVSYFNIPIYNNGIILNRRGFAEYNFFYQRVLKTIEALSDSGCKYQNCYETHTPYLLNKYKYPEVMMKYDYWKGLGYCGNTLYFNTLGIKGKVDPYHVLRLQVQDFNIDEIDKYNFLNYNDHAENNPLLFTLLQHKFGNKSIYEK